MSKTDKLVKRIKKLFDNWLGIVDWLGWHVTVNYYAKVADMPEGMDESSIMNVCADWSYLQATISVCLENCEDEDIESAVVHELCHLLIAPLVSDGEGDIKRLEYTVTTLARILIAMRRK